MVHLGWLLGQTGQLEDGLVLSRLDLPFDKACLAPHRNRNSVRTASVWQVREPIHTRSSGRARHYERWLGPLRDALADGENR